MIAAALGWFDAVVDPFASIDPRLLVVAAAFQVGAVGLRALALRNCVRAAHPGSRVRVVDVTAAYCAGMALNGAVPARGGDALKLLLIRARVAGSALPTIAAAMLVLGLFDAVAMTGLVLAAWIFGPLPLSPERLLDASPTELAMGAAGVAIVVLVARVIAARPAGPRRERLTRRARDLRDDCRRGGAILRTPGRYAVEVAAVQAGAWACRIGVALALLGAFQLPATVTSAVVVVVAAVASAMLPVTPGGVGTQQVFITYALGSSAPFAAAASFSVGLHVGVTAVNVVLGVAGMMLLFGTLRPLAAVRRARGLARSAI
jgi:uncharacterized membrane protein YbhN (UPF0104 family)